MFVRPVILAGALVCASVQAQTFRITSTTPNGEVPGGAIYAGDSVRFVVTAVREGITGPISARAVLREFNADTGAMIRELSSGGFESNGVYRFENFGYRVPVQTCYQACRPGQTLKSSEVKVRIEFQASLEYSVLTPTGSERRTATSAVVRVAVQYPVVTSISVSDFPLQSYSPTVRITVRGAKFDAAKFKGLVLLKTNDHGT